MQPYPTAAQPSQSPQRQEPPRSVQIAVRCMYAGAAMSLISLIVGLTTVSSIKSAIEKAYPKDTSSQIHKIEVADIVIVVIIALIGIGLWVWMARANQAGHSYARILGTVFFAIDTLLMLANFARPHASLGLVFSLLVWLSGLGAVIFLWQRDSGPYFVKVPMIQ
ncbi:MAG: hypothetical protein ACRDNF_09885 [Streptosporangiaceae bacterium]